MKTPQIPALPGMTPLGIKPADTKPTIVRKFSAAGPCLVLGKLTKETAHFYIFDQWQGGDRFQSRARVFKNTPAHYSGAHIEPCQSCRDHPKTFYPQGYTD